MTTELFEQLRSIVNDRFVVERPLDDTGPLHRFVAEERALARRVELVVVPPPTAARIDGARFRADLERAALLDHPHIRRLLTAGAANDVLYYTMPYIDGEPLEARLGRAPALTPDEAGVVLRDVAEALEVAHQHGIVHGGLSAERVMLVNGRGVVGDVGVWAALRAAARPGLAGGVIDAGAGLAAPELQGEAVVADTRADVYALGVLGYRMLAGHPPFEGSPAQVLAAQQMRDPPPLPSARGTVAPEMAELVARCLARDPAERWADGGAVRAALDAVAMLRRVPPVVRPAGRLTRQQVILISGALLVLLLGVVVALMAGRGVVERMHG